MILSLVSISHEILVRDTYYRNFLPNHYYLFCCLSIYLGAPQSCRFIPFNKMSVLFIKGVKICPFSICPMFSLLYCFLGFNSELQIFHYFFFTCSLIIMQRGNVCIPMFSNEQNVWFQLTLCSLSFKYESVFLPPEEAMCIKYYRKSKPIALMKREEASLSTKLLSNTSPCGWNGL